MKLPNLSRVSGLIAVGKTFLSTHRPEILLGTSLATTVGGVVTAGIAGYKSGQQVMREEYADLDLVNPEGKSRELDVKEKIQLTWMNYLPAAGLTAGALGSTTALHLVHVKEKKALATAALAAVDEVKKQIVVMDEEETDKLLEGRADPETGIASIQHGDGEIEELYLVRDKRTGRDIWSNQHRIEDALIEINQVLNNSGDVEVNHFYQHAGFNTLPDGNMFGWNAKDMVSLEWSVTQRDDGRPVREFTFRPTPATGFDRGN